MKYWFAQAPSNIALIKYMGKTDPSQNLPSNPSLSYTLPNLLSYVELKTFAGTQDYWEPLEIPGYKIIELKPQAQERFLAHLQMLKDFFNYQGHFLVRSSNNFPLGSGLASSASSFAALTKCACQALSELTGKHVPDILKQAQLSRLGSGSSCRSFFSPWALWDEQHSTELELPYEHLIHHVIIINEQEKEISSKQAHLAVQTSQNFRFRPERAKERLKMLIAALNQLNWKRAYEICWDEFMDMHLLFETASHPFKYISEASHQALDDLQVFWRQHQDGPIVTMDAGPNIHLLFRPDQKELAQFYVQEYLVNQYNFL
jgi:diphosphomevalonate decarboxylase